MNQQTYSLVTKLIAVVSSCRTRQQVKVARRYVALACKQCPDLSRDYYLRALETFAAYEDSHSLGVVLRNLARLWQASNDAGLPAAVAKVLGLSPEEAEVRLREAL